MRIAMVEVDHWHVGAYAKPIQELGHEIVAASDRHGTQRADDLCVPVYADTAELLEKERPDFAFTFARHREQAETIRTVIDHGVPLCAEKPTALTAADARDLAEAAARQGIFAAVSFAMRLSAFVQHARALAAVAPPRFLSLRYLTGSARRYINWRCLWPTQPDQAGGGPLWNVGTHHVDMACMLLGAPIETVSARMTPDRDFPGIEASATVHMETGDGRAAVVESGYNVPAGALQNYLAVSPAGIVECGGEPMQVRVERPGEKPLTEPGTMPGYGKMIRVFLDRFQAGEEPPSSLADAARVVAVIEAAYRSAGEDRPITLGA